MKTEQEYNKELSEFQLELLEILRDMGFQWKYFNKYNRIGFSEIDVSRFSNMKQVIYHFFNDGSDQKRFEIINALGL